MCIVISGHPQFWYRTIRGKTAYKDYSCTNWVTAVHRPNTNIYRLQELIMNSKTVLALTRYYWDIILDEREYFDIYQNKMICICISWRLQVPKRPVDALTIERRIAFQCKMLGWFPALCCLRPARVLKCVFISSKCS